MRAGQRQAEGEWGPSPATQPPASAFLALRAEWAQPPLRQLPSVAKASGNVPTFRKVMQSPAIREKERERDRLVGAECGGERKCIRDCGEGSVPQNASALSPSLSSPSSPASATAVGQGAAGGSGRPGQVLAPPCVLPATPLLSEGVRREDTSFSLTSIPRPPSHNLFDHLEGFVLYLELK